jgi:hypothetical protein
VHEFSKKVEKTTLSKKDRKKACASERDPYNAPPSTRRHASLSAVSREDKEKKILKNWVDSERGKRNIRHLATAGRMPGRTAL